MTEDSRKAFAFILKALGDYGVNAIVVGVWPDDHLLTYYNGDLDGRVEDMRLVWDIEELRLVLSKGSDALNIEMASRPDGCDRLGRVRQRRARSAPRGASLLGGRRDEDAGGQDDDRGKRRDHSRPKDGLRGDEIPVRSLRRRLRPRDEAHDRGSGGVQAHAACVHRPAPTRSCSTGIDSRELLGRINADKPDPAIRQSDLTQALDRVDRLQAKIGVSPHCPDVQPRSPPPLPRRPDVPLLPQVRVAAVAVGAR